MKIRSLRWLPLLALTLTLSVGNASFAAPKEGGAKAGKGARGDRMGKMLEQLDLTDAQKEKLKPLQLENAKARRTLMADTTLTPEQKKEKTKESRAEFTKKVMEILTPEQKQKLKDLRKAQKAEKEKAGAPAKAA